MSKIKINLKPPFFSKLIAVLLASLCFGCSDFVEDVMLPESPPELVIHCFMYPNMDTIKVHVQKTHPVFANSIDYNQLIVEDAVVFLETQHGEKYYLIFCSQRKQYLLPCTDLIISEGETYLLNVQHDNFPIASAQTTIPAIHSNFEVAKVDSSIRQYNKTYYVETFIHDTPAMRNFYVLYGYLVGVRSDSGAEDNSMEDIFSLRIFPFDEWISDERLDGTSIPKNGNTHTALESMPKKLHFQLYSIDKHFFAFRQSISDLDNLEIDPFATPVKMYTNFNNGHGIFASYSFYIHEISMVLD